jgi:hypothetical protein
MAVFGIIHEHRLQAINLIDKRFMEVLLDLCLPMIGKVFGPV